MKIIVPFAEGFEEIEAVTIVDVLRRASIDVTTVCLKENPVTGSHNIKISCDRNISDIDPSDYDFIILPGGMPGSKNLKENGSVIDIIKDIDSRGGFIGAICAAPMVLGHTGVLDNKTATCFPGFEDQLGKADHRPEPVVVDGNIITGKGPACAVPFALRVIEMIKDKDTAQEIGKGMQVYWM